ncbi:unnamed protein product [Clonostachys byssicola]|uniref:Uncharacterized protein n=1 Tax=Clonostachys byssicola TaxID=160290 RepID=A0A9N9Y4R0_9HYPO|nr:unnamed protein product [Clonostachys byssicola]
MAVRDISEDGSFFMGSSTAGSGLIMEGHGFTCLYPGNQRGWYSVRATDDVAGIEPVWRHKSIAVVTEPGRQFRWWREQQ